MLRFCIIEETEAEAAPNNYAEAQQKEDRTGRADPVPGSPFARKAGGGGVLIQQVREEVGEVHGGDGSGGDKGS